MLILIFGPPSGFVQWCLWLIRIMTDVVLDDVDYATAADTDQLRAFWATRSKHNVVFFADCPNRRLFEVFAQIDVPVLILWEDPADVTAFVMRERGLSVLWALRLTMQCSMTFADFVRLPDSLLLKRGEQTDIEGFLREVAGHFRILLEPEHLTEIERRIAASHGLDLSVRVEDAYLATWPNALPRGAGYEGVPSDLVSVADNLHRWIDAHLHGEPLDEMIVERELFIHGGDPDGYLMGPVEMVGPARCIVFGPYLYLPVGDWVAELRFTVGDNLSKNLLEVDVFQSDVLVSESFRLPAEGHFSAAAHFDIQDPREALQLRLIIREGAIEGSLDLKEVMLRRHP